LDYTGQTFEAMLGWGWKRLLHPDHADRVVSGMAQTGLEREIWEDTFPLRGHDGQYRWFLSRAVPIRDEQGDVVRWFGTNTDVTDLREAQQMLRDADRRKDEFLATLAHELRNPLAPIRSGLELMRLSQKDPETMADVRMTMERQTQQLITLVDDLLDVSRITRGKLNVRTRKVALADVMQSAVEASKPFLDEAGHQLIVDTPDQEVTLDADPHRMAQVISNLLNNSAKYTPAGGRVRLSAEIRRPQVVISVEDNGLGIPADMLERIFEIFAQIDRPQEKGNTGLGIGLSLVKSLVKLHQGTIDVASEGPGQGSIFSVTLPIAQQATKAPPSEHQEPSQKTKSSCKVLVVDDNEAAAMTLSMLVKMLGNVVQTAHDGREAIEKAATFLPDLVLMDIGMPNMKGYEAASHIRQQAWGADMTLVALTGWGQEDDKKKATQAGFNHHLVKPAEPAALEKLLAMANEKISDQ